MTFGFIHALALRKRAIILLVKSFLWCMESRALVSVLSIYVSVLRLALAGLVGCLVFFFQTACSAVSPSETGSWHSVPLVSKASALGRYYGLKTVLLSDFKKRKGFSATSAKEIFMSRS